MEEKIVRASENLPCDLCCIMALECVLHIKISVFKLRTLLGERTPKNHSAVKKDIPENELQDLQALSGMRPSMFRLRIAIEVRLF